MSMGGRPLLSTKAVLDKEVGIERLELTVRQKTRMARRVTETK